MLARWGYCLGLSETANDDAMRFICRAFTFLKEQKIRLTFKEIKWKTEIKCIKNVCRNASFTVLNRKIF